MEVKFLLMTLLVIGTASFVTGSDDDDDDFFGGGSWSSSYAGSGQRFGLFPFPKFEFPKFPKIEFKPIPFPDVTKMKPCGPGEHVSGVSVVSYSDDKGSGSTIITNDNGNINKFTTGDDNKKEKKDEKKEGKKDNNKV